MEMLLHEEVATADHMLLSDHDKHLSQISYSAPKFYKIEVQKKKNGSCYFREMQMRIPAHGLS